MSGLSKEEIEEKIKDISQKINESEDILHKKMVGDIREYRLKTDILEREFKYNSANDIEKYIAALKNEKNQLQRALDRLNGIKKSGMIRTRFTR